MSSESASTPAPAPPERPPVDVPWHAAALRKIAAIVPRAKSEANEAAEAVVRSLKSPLDMAPAPCAVEHDHLLNCIEEARQAMASGGSAEEAERYRQALVLAASGSAHHNKTVEEMCKSLPMTMPQSRLGASLRPCASKAVEFKKCSDDAVLMWFEHLQSVNRKSQEEQGPQLQMPAASSSSSSSSS